VLVHFFKRLVAALCLIAMFSVSAATLASAQSTDETGRRVTDFGDVLSVSRFNPLQGDLIQADFTISGSFDSRVLRITNSSNQTANFDVSTHVDLCAERMSVVTSASYQACRASSSPTGLGLTATALHESFYNLAPGASDASAVALQASDSAGFSVTDPAALGEFIGNGVVDFVVGTSAGFEANGAGGNSLVEVETYANVTISVNYRYANVSIVTTTNGGDGIPLTPGESTTWEYVVTNTGNVELITLDVTDDKNAHVCTIASLAAGASQTCTVTGIAGSDNYNNVGSVSGYPAINPTTPVSADDPTSYVVLESAVVTPEESQGAAPDSSEAAEEDFDGLENPAIDIELATNGIQADVAPGVQVTAGSPIELTYVVTNTGTVDLNNIIVVDATSGEVCRQASLLIAHSVTCTVDALSTCGEQDRLANVQGTSSAGVKVTDADPTHHHANCGTTATTSTNTTSTDTTGTTTPSSSTTKATPAAVSQPDATKTAVSNSDTVTESRVLAFTGVDDGPTKLAISLLGLGFAAILTGEGVRRRATR